jgi:outer membrane protein assembly factor BamD
VKKSILILLSFFIISCSSNDKDEYKNDQSVYENNTLKDFELFELANSYISSKQFELALIELDKLEVLYPSSPFASKSMLVTAYIHFLDKDYEKTRALAEMYKSYYPGSKDIVYANYLEAMTYYVLMKKSDYSQEQTYKAMEKFNFILNAYPNSKYEIDILTKIKLINNNLAAEKLSIAKFYLDKGNTNGSLVYLIDIFKNYSTSLSIEETLFLITKIYYSLGEYELAKNYASILAYNFPKSNWYKKSYNLINGLDDINNDKKWFEKFNPIKLLKQDEENYSNNSSIQPIN